MAVFWIIAIGGILITFPLALKAIIASDPTSAEEDPEATALIAVIVSVMWPISLPCIAAIGYARRKIKKAKESQSG